MGVCDDSMKAGRPAQSNRSSFGVRLCTLRETSGLTQSRIAQQLGISQPAYALWERREVSLKPEQLTTLVKILKIRIEELMEEPQNSCPRSGPVGRARQVFEAFSQMSRHQQQKIIEVVEAMVAQHSNRQAS